MEDSRLTEQLVQMHAEYLKELVQLSEDIVAQGEDGVLFCLYRAERSMLPGEIMARMGLTTGRIANILKRLEEKGLVMRLQDAQDRRKVHVSLTDAGSRSARSFLTRYVTRHQALIDYLGERDAGEMVRLLSRTLDYYRAGGA